MLWYPVSESASLDIRTGSCVALPMAATCGCFQAVRCCWTSTAVAWLVVRSAVPWDLGRTPGGPLRCLAVSLLADLGRCFLGCPPPSFVSSPPSGPRRWVPAVPGTTSPLDSGAVGPRGAVGAVSWAAAHRGVPAAAGSCWVPPPWPAALLDLGRTCWWVSTSPRRGPHRVPVFAFSASCLSCEIVCGHPLEVDFVRKECAQFASAFQATPSQWCRIRWFLPRDPPTRCCAVLSSHLRLSRELQNRGESSQRQSQVAA